MNAGTAFVTVVVVVGLIIGLSFLFSWPVYMLWNGCLISAVDGVHEITWLQAWGISALCSFLFKSYTSNTKQ
jgi:hypothetical protein